MKVSDFLSEFAARWKAPTLDPKSFCSLKYSTSVIPSQYLQFAEKDLRLGGSRGLINSLGNSKRAIDCQIHGLLFALGIDEPRSFPARLDRVQALGLIAPRVIRKIVRLRNVLEHEYYEPTISEVEDALDIAALFIAALKPYFGGGLYMDSAWIADERSVNPRGEMTKTKTHTMWRHDSEPRYTYSSGVFVDTEAGSKRIDLSFVHDNAEVCVASVAAKDRGFVELQGLLLRSEIDSLPYTRAGAKHFLRAIAMVV